MIRTVRHVRERSFKAGVEMKSRASDYGMPVAYCLYDPTAGTRTSLENLHMHILGKCGDREVAWILLALTALVVLAVNVYAAALP
jgi:hypothetical protein